MATLTKNGEARKKPGPKPRNATQPISPEGVPVPEREGSDDGERFIETTRPYEVEILVKGDADFLFHNYSCDAVDAKSRARKGSEGKKSDDLESYVYRDRDGNLGCPTLNLIAAIAKAGKGHADPRSPRKSAHDLLKAVLIPSGPQVAPFLNPASGRPVGKSWEFVDTRRVCVQRNAVSRSRPAMREGWEIKFSLRVLSPDHVPPKFLRRLIQDAGLFCALGDYRPTFGRFTMIGFKIVERKS